MPRPQTVRCLKPCGCHVERDTIVFCHYHERTQEMANVLHLIRGYFLKTLGDDAPSSPFVQKIDALLPRLDGSGD